MSRRHKAAGILAAAAVWALAGAVGVYVTEKLIERAAGEIAADEVAQIFGGEARWLTSRAI